MRWSLIFLTLFFSAFAANTFCQIASTDSIQSSRGIDSEKFESLVNELDYNKTKNVWRLKEPEKKEEIEEEEYIDLSEPTERKGFNFNGSIANALAYIMIIGLIALVIYLIFSNVQVDKKIEDPEINMSDIEDIDEVDTLDGFKKAITVSDYRSAIRMQFIKVLQMLQDDNHIHWRPEKTNRNYLQELNGTEFKADFRELSGIYELVWYGNTSLDKELFEQLNPSFDQFINRGNEQ